MTEPQDIQRPGEIEETVDSRLDDRLDDEAIAAIEAAGREAPDPREFGLSVPVPLGDVAIRVQNLGIRYNLNFTRKTKLRTTIARLIDPRRRNKGHFWALRGVDLEVKRGEAVGIIGPNGSGKSTILLALAGIVQPSEGVVEVNGHVSTLLSLSAGFDAELTGRENIALAGALMGIDEKVMEEITPGIIKFANVGAFIDAPLKTYSSGMRARVGFSIATAVDPDILLLDEVLGTGDNKFKRKSQKRMAEVLRSAKAVVMVTHDMSWITAFCTRAILLDKGRIVADGDPLEVAEMHEKDEERRKENKRKVRRMMSQGLIPAGGVARKAAALAEAEAREAEAKAGGDAAVTGAAGTGDGTEGSAAGSASGEPAATASGESKQVERGGQAGKSADAAEGDSTESPEPLAAAAGRAGSKEEPPPSP